MMTSESRRAEPLLGRDPIRRHTLRARIDTSRQTAANHARRRCGEPRPGLSGWSDARRSSLLERHSVASTTNRLVIAPVGNDLPFKWVGGFAASCFVGALFTDIVYAEAPNAMWVTFSVWLITIGLIVAGVAALVGFIDRVAHHRLGMLGNVWPYLIGFAAVVVVSIFNAFVHSRDAYQAVVPGGITLSAVAVALLVLTAIVGRAHTRSRTRKTPL
ncbi:MAG: DUF2231 domain-containing protein [Burkholderiaceae bacterium]